jgi:hypothetical protein
LPTLVPAYLSNAAGEGRHLPAPKDGGPKSLRHFVDRPDVHLGGEVNHRLATEFRALPGGNVAMLLVKINPIIRGRANYYHGVASSRVFAALDRHLWQLTYKWACHRHPDKPKPWIVNRYFGRYNSAGSSIGGVGLRCRGLRARAFVGVTALVAVVATRTARGGGTSLRRTLTAAHNRASSSRTVQGRRSGRS